MKETIIAENELNELVQKINVTNFKLDDFVMNRNVRIYDFCRPDRFTGYSNALSNIHDTLARSWTNVFFNYTQKIEAHFYCKSIDDASYEVFVRSFPQGSIFLVTQGVLDSAVLPRSFVIAMDSCFLIEQSVIDDISKSLLDEYAKAWCLYGMNLEFILKSIETHPQKIIVDSPEEVGMWITLEAKINNVEGSVNIFLPYLFFKPLLQYLPKILGGKESNRNLNQKESVMDNRFESKIETGLDNVKVQVVTELGRTVKTLKEIKDVKEGSMMLMNAYSGEPVDIFVNNVLFGKGEVIVIDECFGVRFTEVIGQDHEQQKTAGIKDEQKNV